MSLLMDALRKAEEAKKKAELDGKSVSKNTVDSSIDDDIEDDDVAESTTAEAAQAPAPLIRKNIEVPDIGSNDIELEFMEPDPAEAALSDDLATERLVESESAETELTVAKLEDDDDSDSEIESAKYDTSGIAYRVEPLPKPVVAKPVAPTPVAKPDPFAIEYAPTSRAERVEARGKVVVKESATPAQIRPRIAPTAVEVEVDTKLEEMDRRSAQNVFAAKRKKSPLKNNLVFAGLGVAAILVLGIGVYFYIGLRNSSGIAIPAGNYVASEYSDETLDESAMLDQELVDAEFVDQELVAPIEDRVEEIALQTPSAANLDRQISQLPSAPPASQTAIVTEPAISASVNSAPIIPGPINPEPAIADPIDSRAVSAQTGRAVPVDTVPIAPATITTTNNTVASSSAPRQPESPAVSNPITSDNTSTASINPSTLQPQVIEPESVVSFSRRETTSGINPLVQQAYAAYQQGNLSQAESLYREVLTTTPLNRNALLGLATIASSNGDTVTALELFSRMLARDPSDPVAKAGILEIMPSGSLQEQESALKRLLRMHPNIAPLSYAMGNFMAAQQRWQEAQQAYFSALQSAKSNALSGAVNPDYAFNLAVSLEHLGQPVPASNYYREALELANNHPAGFDQAAVRQRLLSMEAAR